MDSSHPADAPPLLRMTGISKSFPGVRALNDVSLELRAGEVLALLGENGAGKSTLMKILGGAIRPDAGELAIDGHTIHFHSPRDARHAGIGIIYQEFNLVPALTARENIFLGQETSRWGWLSAGRERRTARSLLERLAMTVPADALCRDLTVAEQQMVEIAKALSLQARILVMDEPSAALSPREVEGLFRVVRELRSRGIAVIYISHRLDEVFRIADRVMVLRDGNHVATRPANELTRRSVIEMMVGRELEDESPKQHHATTDVRLSVQGLSRRNAVHDVSFTILRGEVLAMTGLVGSGRTETARLIFGADRRDAGVISLDGRVLRIRGPRDAIRAGICLLTEDRKSEGLVMTQSIQENFGLPNMSSFARLGLVDHRAEARAFDAYAAQLRIKVADRRRRAATLSGGNQQKVVLAKWLQRSAEVIIFDEPTRGIDVGAKREIYLLMNDLAAKGKAILMISSELPEVLGMADRILVMHDGRVRGEISDVGRCTQQYIMHLATGGDSDVDQHISESAGEARG